MSKNIVMQVKCVHCGREQYGVAVFDISHGKHPCVWCGKTPKVYTDETEYWADVDKARGTDE